VTERELCVDDGIKRHERARLQKFETSIVPAAAGEPAALGLSV
jgi:hypothetical protein